MPKGPKRNKDLKQSFEELDKKIQYHENCLGKLKEERRRLKEYEQKMDTERLMRAIAEHQISVDAVISVLPTLEAAK